MKKQSITITLLLATALCQSLALAQSAPSQAAATNAVSDSLRPPGDPVGDRSSTGQPFRLGDDQPRPQTDTMPPTRTINSESFISSPTGALLRSVAFPGWGQWSNGKKQKAAVYFGIESYWITKAMIWRHRARTAGNLSEFTHARDRRNSFYWLTGITIFVSMFDAYADRYLLTLERTRDMPGDFWGGNSEWPPRDDWSLVLTVKF
jgi:hypothetical protein